MRDAVLVQVIEAVEEGVKDHLDSRFLGELSSIPSSDSSDTNDEMREKNAKPMPVKNIEFLDDLPPSLIKSRCLCVTPTVTHTHTPMKQKEQIPRVCKLLNQNNLRA